MTSANEAMPALRAGIGSTVSVRFQNQQPRTFTILAGTEGAPDKGTISQNSPLARALTGRATGDTVVYLVGDKLITVEIKEIK